jgi:hypothetical protein
VAKTRGVRNPHEFVTLEAGEILPQPANRETSVMGIRSRLAWQGTEGRGQSRVVAVPKADEWKLIQAVFSGRGETIVDESREYGTWAEWLGMARHTFSAVMGAVIARGQHYRGTFQVLRPGFNLGVEEEWTENWR